MPERIIDGWTLTTYRRGEPYREPVGPQLDNGEVYVGMVGRGNVEVSLSIRGELPLWIPYEALEAFVAAARAYRKETR